MSRLFGRVLGAVSQSWSFGSTSQESSQSQPTDAMPAASSTATAASKSPVKKRLLEEEDDDDDQMKDGEGSDSSEDEPAFKINEEYARRFEHNKKREEKQKLEEKYGKEQDDGSGDDDDDSESSSDEGTEDEDGYLLTEDLDARMSAALQAIRNKDPRVYTGEAKFFDPAEAEAAAANDAAPASKPAKEKPMYLRDYHRERLLRGDIGADDVDDDNNGGAQVAKTYQQEQEDLKKELIAEMHAEDATDSDGEAKAKPAKKGKETSGGDDEKSDKDDEDDEDDEDDADAFLKPKAASAAARNNAHGVHPSRAERIQITEADVAQADKNPELFLSNFLASRAWVPDSKDDGGHQWAAFDSDDDDGGDDDGAREEFEAAYNLRFEDPEKSNAVLKSYSRTVVAERTVRREAKTARQRQREEERARRDAEKQARREERARLRKLRVEEAQAKLAKIKEAAGLAGRNLAEEEWMALLDDAWDNDAWEANMRKHFGEDYYAEKDDGAAEAAAEAEAEAAAEADAAAKSKKNKKPKKPKWDDDIDIKDIVPDFDDEAAPPIALTDDEGEKEEKDGEEEEDEEEEEDDDDDDDDNEDNGHAAKRRKTGKDRKQDRAEAKRAARRERARIEALVDRQLAIDAPAVGPASASASASSSSAAAAAAAAGPFRYRETSPQAFGLTARDILLAPSDQALNEFAGLKKLAVFRDEERKRRDRKKLGKKARLRQWRRDTFGRDFEHTGPTFGFERFLDQEDGAGAGGSAPDGSLKRKRKDKAAKAAKAGKDSKAAGKAPTGDAAAEPAKKKRKRSRKHKATSGAEAE